MSQYTETVSVWPPPGTPIGPGSEYSVDPDAPFWDDGTEQK